MYEVKFSTETPELATIVFQVLTELTRAKELHPQWPDCNIKRAALVVEEAGEAIREANRMEEGVSFVGELKIELIQTAAMAIRHLEVLALEKAQLEDRLHKGGLSDVHFNDIPGL